MQGNGPLGRREFLARITALGVTLSLPARLLAASQTAELSANLVDPHLNRGPAAPAFAMTARAFRPQDVITVAETFGLKLSPEQAASYLEVLRDGLALQRGDERLALSARSSSLALRYTGNDAGPWLGALLGASAGILAGRGEPAEAVRLGARLFNEASPELGLSVHAPEQPGELSRLPGALRPLEGVLPRQLAPMWQQIAARAGLPKLGDTRLPDAGVVVKPQWYEGLGMFRVRRLNSLSIGQEMLWDYERLPGFATSEDYIRAAMYVVVEGVDGRVQMRAHPVETLGLFHSGPSTRSLTQGSLFLGLCVGADAQVLAAGHLFLRADGSILGLTADLGRLYLDDPGTSEDQGLAVASGVLQALGYDLGRASRTPIADLTALNAAS
jgi:hypothetical protein